MTVTYQDLLNFSDFIVAKSGSVYNNKYANRNSNSNSGDREHKSTITSDDVDALLNALARGVSDTEYDWVGKNCSYSTATECVNVNGVMKKTVTVQNSPTDKYSKCNYNNNSNDNYIISHNIPKAYDCAPLQTCGSSVKYIWDETHKERTKWFLTNMPNANNTIEHPGVCVKVYNGQTGKKTTDPNDPYRKISSNPSENVPNDDGQYDCLDNGEVTRQMVNGIADGTYNKTQPNEKIGSDSSPLGIECSEYGIHYGGGGTSNGPDLYDIQDGYDKFLEPASINSDGDKLGAQTVDCKVNVTKALYVKKGNPSEICDADLPLYPGDDEQQKYDLPLNGDQRRSDWWDDNTCVWRNQVIKEPDPNSYTYQNQYNEQYGYYIPSRLNGVCHYDSAFGYKGSNASGAVGITEIDCTEGSAPEDGISCADIPANVNTIALDIDCNKYKKIVSNSSPDICPGINHPGNTDSFPNSTYGSNYNSPCTAGQIETEYRWVDQSQIIPDSAKIDDPDDENTDAYNIDGNFKTYIKNVADERKYSIPCYYDSDPNTKYLLVKDAYRGVNISRNLNTYDPAYTNLDKPLEFSKGVKDQNDALNSTIIWYSGDELADLKGSNSEVITNYGTDGIDILKRTPNTGQVDPTSTGTGVGECWFPLEIQKMPNFRNIDNLYSTTALRNDTQDVFDAIEGNAVGIKDLGSANKKAKMDAIKRKIVENSSVGDFLYYNIGDIGTQECEDEVDSLVNTSYAWIDKIGSS
tara:strand:- start:2292 stop:4538 length:2247 start_codon:yes stop_codon:yes gene_type:complete